MESIKTELNLTTGKRQELERRLQHAQEEKESLTSSLEEASDRIHMLERHAREQETKLEVSSERKRDVITSPMQSKFKRKRNRDSPIIKDYFLSVPKNQLRNYSSAFKLISSTFFYCFRLCVEV